MRSDSDQRESPDISSGGGIPPQAGRKTVIPTLICLSLLVGSCIKPTEAERSGVPTNVGNPGPLFRMAHNDKWGYIDKTRKIVIKPQFEYAECFSEGLAAVLTDRKWSYIDKTGKAVIKPHIGRAGKMVIEPQFHMATLFSNGIAQVKGEGYPKKLFSAWDWVYVDKTGKYTCLPAGRSGRRRSES